MNILQRFKNIWKMSQFIPLDHTKPSETGDVVTQITKPRRMAEVIKKRVDPIEEIIKHE